VKRRLQTALLLALTVGCLVFLWRHFFPNEERRVRRCLTELAQAASVPDHPTPAATLLAGERLRNLLASDLVVEVDLPEIGRHSVTDRAQVIHLALAAWDQLKGLKVELVDVRVAVAQDRATATAELTAKATRTGEKDFFFQELKLQLRQEDGQWRVSRVETVRVLKL
jgi:ketosteroid isomerase-like protein